MIDKQAIVDAVIKLRAGDIYAWEVLEPLLSPETDTNRQYTDSDSDECEDILAEMSVTQEEWTGWEMRCHEHEHKGLEHILDADPDYDWIKGEPHPEN